MSSTKTELMLTVFSKRKAAIIYGLLLLRLSDIC